MIKEYYEKNLSWNERISSVIGKNHSHLDELILDRHPNLSFGEDGKVEISKIYQPYEEIRQDTSPYDQYFRCVEKTFDLKEIKTFCDVGCSTGHLIANMLPHCDSCGIEYFQFQKDNASEFVKECINVLDIRDPIQENIEFDLVNCTEVAEHVDPKFLDIFLDNLKKITGKYLILTWSSTYPPEGAPPQHISPLFQDDVEKLMVKWGFELDEEKTKTFIDESLKYDKFHYWWRETLTVWRVK
jgi:SAM-dependent methyltransferase